MAIYRPEASVLHRPPMKHGLNTDFQFLAVFDGIPHASKHQAPSTNLQAPEKLQISSSKPRPERCGGHPGRHGEVWILELLKSLGLGILSFSAGYGKLQVQRQRPLHFPILFRSAAAEKLEFLFGIILAKSASECRPNGVDSNLCRESS